MAFLTAISFVAGLTITLAVLLSIANQKLKVYEDPRIDDVEELLPGANCGACGLPGCRVFAEKVVKGEITPSQCPVGGPQSAGFIANYLGVEMGQLEKKVARLLCAGGRDVAIQVAEYEGFSSCRAAATIVGGFKGCSYGCLGLGDCVEACTFDAISLASNSLPVVDSELCTSCGDCVDICPKGLYEIAPVASHLVVQCKSVLEGDGVLGVCEVGCNGCGICAADAPVGLITMENNLPVINPEKLELQTDIATLRCPTGAIQWVEEQQFEHLFDKVKSDPEQEVEYGAI